MDIAPVPKLSGTEWAAARKRAIATLDAICALCGGPIDLQAKMHTPLAVEVDHKVPRSRGGALYELDNLQLTHHKCNRKKGARMESDYPKGDNIDYVPLSNPW